MASSNFIYSDKWLPHQRVAVLLPANIDKLIACISVKTLLFLTFLQQHGVFTRFDVESVNSFDHNHECALKIIEFLVIRQGGWQALHEWLRNNRYEHISQLLESSAQLQDNISTGTPMIHEIEKSSSASGKDCHKSKYMALPSAQQERPRSRLATTLANWRLANILFNVRTVQNIRRAYTDPYDKINCLAMDCEDAEGFISICDKTNKSTTDFDDTADSLTQFSKKRLPDKSLYECSVQPNFRPADGIFTSALAIRTTSADLHKPKCAAILSKDTIPTTDISAKHHDGASSDETGKEKKSISRNTTDEIIKDRYCKDRRGDNNASRCANVFAPAIQYFNQHPHWSIAVIVLSVAVCLGILLFFSTKYYIDSKARVRFASDRVQTSATAYIKPPKIHRETKIEQVLTTPDMKQIISVVQNGTSIIMITSGSSLYHAAINANGTLGEPDLLQTVPFLVSSLAVDQTGRVYMLDAERLIVHVYDDGSNMQSTINCGSVNKDANNTVRTSASIVIDTHGHLFYCGNFPLPQQNLSIQTVEFCDAPMVISRKNVLYYNFKTTIKSAIRASDIVYDESHHTAQLDNDREVVYRSFPAMTVGDQQEIIVAVGNKIMCYNNQGEITGEWSHEQLTDIRDILFNESYRKFYASSGTQLFVMSSIDN